MAEAAVAPYLSPEEYFALERESEIRHEYFDGEIFAMAGGTFAHSLLIGNLARELGNALKGRPCFVFPVDMRVQLAADRRYTYPDVTVVCGEPRFETGRRDTLLNPLLIFEVLSESTERYDRGAKFGFYRALPTLSDYLLVSQDQALVEHFHRAADDSWVLRTFSSGDRLELLSLGVALAVDEIYDKVLDEPLAEPSSA